MYQLSLSHNILFIFCQQPDETKIDELDSMHKVKVEKMQIDQTEVALIHSQKLN